MIYDVLYMWKSGLVCLGPASVISYWVMDEEFIENHILCYRFIDKSAGLTICYIKKRDLEREKRKKNGLCFWPMARLLQPPSIQLVCPFSVLSACSSVWLWIALIGALDSDGFWFWRQLNLSLGIYDGRLNLSLGSGGLFSSCFAGLSLWETVASPASQSSTFPRVYPDIFNLRNWVSYGTLPLDLIFVVACLYVGDGGPIVGV